MLTTRLRPHCLLFTPIPEEPRMDNATGTGTRVPAAVQLVLYPTRSAAACRKKQSHQHCTVLYCTHPLWQLAGRWGGPSPVQHQGKQLRSQYRSAPVVGPSQKSQPWNHTNSICTYSGTTDSCCVQYGRTVHARLHLYPTYQRYRKQPISDRI